MLPLHTISEIDGSSEEIILSSGKFIKIIVKNLIKWIYFAANYSRLNVKINFNRNVDYYLVQVYIPCTMLVIMAWLTFFLNENAINVRAMLCGIVFLAMIFGLNSIQSFVPKTSYTKSLDIFTGISMTLVFVAVIGKIFFI